MQHIDNPFYITNNIPAEFFCDREKETADLTRLLTNGNNVTLYSPRRMGKTGLIYHCYETPEFQEYYTIFVDLLATQSLQEFTYTFGKEVFNTLKSKGSKMLSVLFGTLRSLTAKFGVDEKGMPSFNVTLGDVSRPQFTLEEIFECIEKADKPCILAFDEFQQVAKYQETNVEALLRTHIQKMQNCRFVFSGSETHLLREMFQNHSRAFFQSTSTMILKAIDKEKYAQFAVRNFEKFNRHVDSEGVIKIYDMLDGYTYYMQKVMNNAFSLTQEGGHCDAELLISSLSRMIEMEDNTFSQMAATINTKQKLLLYAIASERKAKGITSEEFILRYNLASASAVQYSARMLLQNEIISKASIDGETVYIINNKFFEIWIRQKLGKY